MAPANASRPPATHVERNSSALGTDAAICGGVNRMPPPITLETIIAAASSGPSRRSRIFCGALVVVGAGGLYGPRVNSQLPKRTNLERWQLAWLGVANYSVR